MSNRAWWIAALLLGPATALAGGGGGGVMLNGSLYPLWEDSADYDAPGGLACVGGVGFGFADSGLRIGGEGMGCRGRAGVGMVLGGAQVGFEHGRGAVWWSVHSGVGMGSLVDRTQVSGDYQSLFAYVRPEFTVGIDLPISAIEVGIHALTPINVVQWVGEEGEGRGVVHPTIGAQVSFLFGNFDHGPRWTPPQQLAVPGPSEPHGPPPDVHTAPAEPPPEEPPLAIPADEADYPPPPPPQ